MTRDDGRRNATGSSQPPPGKRYPLIARAWLASAVLAMSSATAGAGDEALIDFLAGQGCAIGPTTRMLAIEAGFEEAAIEALAETASADPDSVQSGDWIVLSADSCEIRPPRVTSELRLDDPEIRSRISAVDAYTVEDERGCFLDTDNLYEELMATRGWQPDKAMLEYLRLLAETLVSGELAFYSDDILRTPAGFQLTSGDCADVPNIEEIRRSHRVLIDNFDRLIRADMEHAVCEADGAPSTTLAGWRVARPLLADRSGLRSIGLLLCLDEGQHIAETFVLGNRRMGDALLRRVEDPVGQGQPFPADLEGPARPGVGLDIAPDRAARRRQTNFARWRQFYFGSTMVYRIMRIMEHISLICVLASRDRSGPCSIHMFSPVLNGFFLRQVRR